MHHHLTRQIKLRSGLSVTFQPVPASPSRAQPAWAIALVAAPPPYQTEQAALGAVCDIPACPGVALPDTAGHAALPWHCHAMPAHTWQ